MCDHDERCEITAGAFWILTKLWTITAHEIFFVFEASITPLYFVCFQFQFNFAFNFKRPLSYFVSVSQSFEVECKIELKLKTNKIQWGKVSHTPSSKKYTQHAKTSPTTHGFALIVNLSTFSKCFNVQHQNISKF